MGYQNSFKLQLKGSIDTISNQCDNCDKDFNSIFKFYPNCSKKLTKVVIAKDTKESTEEIINLFRKKSIDASRLIDDFGETMEAGSGYDIQSDLVIFSKEYPNILFQLDVLCDPGFGGLPERFYIKNGETQQAKVEIVYEEFDERELKV